MTVTLKPVTRDDINPLSKLKVAPEQTEFVAPNEYSLAQVHYETGATPYVIWDGDTRVGFCQVIDMRQHKHRLPEDDPEAFYLWRLMIGASFQGQGHGRAAMALLIEMAKTAGHVTFETSAVKSNSEAVSFYQGLGFKQTGQIVDNEIQLRLKL